MDVYQFVIAVSNHPKTQRLKISICLALELQFWGPTHAWLIADQLDARGDKAACPFSSSRLFRLAHVVETGPGERVDTHKTSYGLGLALGCCLLAKIHHKANLSSRGGETDYTVEETR